MSKPRSLTEIMKEKETSDANESAQQVITWMEEKLGAPLPKKPFRELIWDGQLLCKVANALKPGCIRKFHRQPRLHMMQVENVGFFLTACKTRFGLPDAALFEPTDVQDENDETSLSSLRKILAVLTQLSRDYPGSNQVGEISVGGTSATFEEPSPESLQEPEPEPQPEPEPEPEPVVAPVKSTPVAVSQNAGSGVWYINGTADELSETQKAVLGEITSTINNHLSCESKRSLIDELRAEVHALRKKLANSSDAELRTLAHEYGLGNSVSEVPASKERNWYIDWILKYGRKA
eukprot:TRINITY_DN13664_c0_g1_i1.p1 TRINITY_DN13664_c0_g1~~TRINITY_DN13664_c0_g1_i1.p1  ORF type:complete len:292 (-),score=54.95 TRINITY_DN13664_c0_g1_i1:62-937(-)